MPAAPSPDLAAFPLPQPIAGMVGRAGAHHPASLHHRSCPPGRSRLRGDVVFSVFLDTFSDMLQYHVSSVSVVLDVYFNCSMWMLQK
jgi:hypothetical protein